jgi:2'-5' RNA ligase
MKLMRKRRIFIGINIPSEIKKELKKLQNEIAKKNLPLRLVDLSNLHITLNFLGLLTDREIVNVRHALELTVPNFPSFNAKLSDIRFFPSHARVNVVTVIIESNGKLEQLQKEIQKELAKFPFLKLEKREFKPHITIGRVKGKGIKTIDIERIKNLKIEKKEWQIQEIELIQSVLSKSGSKYTILKSFGLKEIYD